MRLLANACLCLATLGVTLSIGCAHTFPALRQYFPSSKYYPLGTVKVQSTGKDVRHAHDAAVVFLQEGGFSINSDERGEDRAVIHASRSGIRFVVDIQEAGAGSEVRIEAEQAGLDADVWELINAIDLLP